MLCCIAWDTKGPLTCVFTLSATGPVYPTGDALHPLRIRPVAGQGHILGGLTHYRTHDSVPAMNPTAYLVHWSQTPSGLDHGSNGSISGATYLGTEAELLGFMLGLPGDFSFVVHGVSEVPVRRLASA